MFESFVSSHLYLGNIREVRYSEEKKLFHFYAEQYENVANYVNEA